jgi:hypothetical protein
MPDIYDDILAASGLSVPPPTDPSSGLLEKMRAGVFGQESTNNYNVRPNPRTGATGGFQVMPANIPSWTKKHYGQSLTPEQFQNNPDAQEAVFSGEMGNYLKTAAANSPDDETTMRKAAAAWYGGPGAMDRYDDPKRFRRNEPSFREYTTSVLNKAKGAPLSNDELINHIVGQVGSTPPSPEDDVLTAAGLNGSTKPIIPVTGPGPTNPTTQTLQTPVVPPVQPSLADTQPPPVPEAPQTIGAQATSMLDANSPRSAVLVTPGEQLPLLANSSGLTTVKLPEGTLIVNHRKLGLKPADIPTYVKKNGFAALIGKVEDVGNNTATGAALVTKDASGNELSSSVVTSPESAQKQAQVDKAQFPQAASQTVVPAQAVVADRVNQPSPASVEGPTPPQVPVQQSPISTGQPTNVQPATFDPKAFHTANAYLVSQGQKPLSKEEFLSTIGSFGSDVQAGYNPSDFKIGEQSVTSPDLQQGETVGKGTLTQSPIVGKTPKELSQISVGTYTPTEAKSGEDAAIQSLVAAGRKWDITPQEASQWVANRKREGKTLFAGMPDGYKFQPGDQIEVAASTIADIRGPEAVESQLRQQNAQNQINNVDLSAQTKASLSPEALNEALGPKGAAIIGGVIGSGGRIAGSASGILDFINDLSPTKGESMAQALDPTARVVRPDDNIQDVLKDTSDAAEQAEQKTGDNGYFSSILKVAGATPGDLSRLILLSHLPGGMVSGMALDSASQARAKNLSGGQIAGQALKGGALGALFSIAPSVGGKVLGATGSKLLAEGTELGTISGGTYAIAKASGDSNQDAFREAVVNGAFHLTSVIGAHLKGKAIRAVDDQGNEATVEIKDGKVVTTDKEPEVQLYIPITAEQAKNAPRTTETLSPEIPPQSASIQEAANVPNAETSSPSEPVTGNTEPLKPAEPTDMSAVKNNAVAPETKTVTHPNPEIDGKPIVSTREDGKVIVPNENNKGGISVVTDHSAQGNGLEATNEQTAQTETPAAKSNEPAAPDLAANHDVLKQAFELPLLRSRKEVRSLGKQIDVTYESESGRSITRQMKASDRQAQLESKGNVLQKLLSCIHGA